MEPRPITAPEGTVFLFGASGHAKVVIDIVERAKAYRIIGLFDDSPREGVRSFFGYPLLGNRQVLLRFLETWTQGVRGLVTIGDNQGRRSVAGWLKARGVQFGDAIHPSAQVGRDVTIGAGSVIMAQAVVNPTTCLGECTIINTGASVDHDCRIGSYVHIAPGSRLCGDVTIGEGTFIGAGTVVIPGVRVGCNAIVGAGSTVIRNIPDNTKVAGSPAHKIETRL